MINPQWAELVRLELAVVDLPAQRVDVQAELGCGVFESQHQQPGSLD